MVTREICKCCGRENPLGFHVPDDVWERAVPEPYKNRVLCIMCFDHFATAAGVDWTDTPVEFYPVSGVYFARSEGQPVEAVAARTAPDRPVLLKRLAKRVRQLQEENRRLREALEVYADPDNWWYSNSNPLLPNNPCWKGPGKGPDIARAALEQGEDGRDG